jgi:hypothetical protein
MHPVKSIGTLKFKNKMKAANVTKTKSKKLMGADKTPSGKTGGTNPALKKQTKPKGKVGGTSKAPKTAIPEAMYGRMMKKGGMVKAKKK